jgi:probable rRNA maturation factor
MITFHTEDIKFNIKNKRLLKSWIKDSIQNENHSVGDLTYVFCSDKYLLNMNKEHLSHDYYTDIITFNYNVEKHVSGDFFISVERVGDNASQQNNTLIDELHRVLIHGVLHLVGYNDKTDLQQAEMTSKEDYYLNLRPL